MKNKMRSNMLDRILLAGMCATSIYAGGRIIELFKEPHPIAVEISRGKDKGSGFVNFFDSTTGITYQDNGCDMTLDKVSYVKKDGKIIDIEKGSLGFDGYIPEFEEIRDRTVIYFNGDYLGL